MTLSLVIGGTRSGKSKHAEQLAHDTGRTVRYVATADGEDPAWADRIAAHRARRPGSWSTVQANGRVSDHIDSMDGPCVLIDGLGAWIATSLHHAGAFQQPEPEVLRRVANDILADVARLVWAAAYATPVIVVAEQAGEGVLPPDPVSRAWLDILGDGTQFIAVHAHSVELVVAGCVTTVARRSQMFPPAGSPDGP